MKIYQSYKIRIHRSAQKFLDSLDVIERAEVFNKIKDLISPTAISDVKKLKGYKNRYRLKCDDFRIVFAPDVVNSILDIGLIGYRKDIYE